VLEHPLARLVQAGEALLGFGDVEAEVAREALDVAVLDLDAGIAAAVAGALRAVVADDGASW